MTKENAAADGRTSTAATEKKLCYHSFIFQCHLVKTDMKVKEGEYMRRA